MTPGDSGPCASALPYTSQFEYASPTFSILIATRTVLREYNAASL